MARLRVMLDSEGTMGRFKDIYGSAFSAAITGGLFVMPLVLALADAMHTPTVEIAWDDGPDYEAMFTADGLADLMALAEGEELEASAPEPAEPTAEPVAQAPKAPRAPAIPVVEPAAPSGDEAPQSDGDGGTPAQAPRVADGHTSGTTGPGAIGSGRRPSSGPTTSATAGRRVPAGGELAAMVSTRPQQGPRASASKARRCGEDNPAIVEISEKSFRIDRALVDWYAGSMDRINSLGWSGAYNEEGDRGWRIGGFSCRSPLYKGGLRANDIIQTVNGKKTNTLLQIIGVYLKYRKADTFTIGVLRKGELVTLQYRLV